MSTANTPRKRRKRKPRRKFNLLDKVSRGIGYGSYSRYLASAHWKTVLAENKRSECECCGKSDDLHLHHATYKNLGAEQPGDLVTVCRQCHAAIHLLVKRKVKKLAVAHLERAAVLDLARETNERMSQHGSVKCDEQFTSFFQWHGI